MLLNQIIRAVDTSLNRGHVVNCYNHSYDSYWGQQLFSYHSVPVSIYSEHNLSVLLNCDTVQCGLSCN